MNFGVDGTLVAYVSANGSDVVLKENINLSIRSRRERRFCSYDCEPGSILSDHVNSDLAAQRVQKTVLAGVTQPPAYDKDAMLMNAHCVIQQFSANLKTLKAPLTAKA